MSREYLDIVIPIAERRPQLTGRMGRALQSTVSRFEPWSWNPGALEPDALPSGGRHTPPRARESRLTRCGVDYTMSVDLRKLQSSFLPANSAPTFALIAARVVELPQVGGLHHRYERLAA